MKRASQDLPAWVFHGRKDPVVPFDDSVKMVEALRQAGASHIKFTEYEDTAHDAWTGACLALVSLSAGRCS
jgi:predicted peptidase